MENLSIPRNKARIENIDGRSFISNMLQLEKEYEVEFEHMHVATSSDEVATWYDYERKLVLECERKAKEVREK